MLFRMKSVRSVLSFTQSNGKAENAVRTVKRLFEKCKETGMSEFEAPLDWRNTPPEGMDTSPAQHLTGRRCRALLPMSESPLQPSYCVVICVRWPKGKITPKGLLRSARESASVTLCV